MRRRRPHRTSGPPPAAGPQPSPARDGRSGGRRGGGEALRRRRPAAGGRAARGRSKRAAILRVFDGIDGTESHSKGRGSKNSPLASGPAEVGGPMRRRTALPPSPGLPEALKSSASAAGLSAPRTRAALALRGLSPCEGAQVVGLGRGAPRPRLLALERLRLSVDRVPVKALKSSASAAGPLALGSSRWTGSGSPWTESRMVLRPWRPSPLRPRRHRGALGPSRAMGRRHGLRSRGSSWPLEPPGRARRSRAARAPRGDQVVGLGRGALAPRARAALALRGPGSL